ncbi:hypothetical protein H2865_002281 [Escherichia coli]|nr:hypothetical protein [Escherichia coli]EJT2321845.1 hypothetical protein [Escherichia coli]
MAISSYSTVTDKFANLTKMPDGNNGLQKNQKNFVCLLVMRRSIQ